MPAGPNSFMKKRKSVRVKPVPKGLVFVVDDNALLVEFAATVLQTAGYSVKPFVNPKAVVAALRQAKRKPSVLVTDYEMAEMNGLDLIRNSHKIHPSLKTLLVSGTVDSSITLTHPAKVHLFLGKPYDPVQLKKAVAELMGM
jgi:response regulator RpfG family c-di-GMP phosphodiesterase